MDPSIRDKFESKGVAYIRNYSSVKPFISQPLQLKGWSALFETERKEEVEEELRRTNMDFKWGVSVLRNIYELELMDLFDRLMIIYALLTKLQQLKSIL